MKSRKIVGSTFLGIHQHSRENNSFLFSCQLFCFVTCGAFVLQIRSLAINKCSGQHGGQKCCDKARVNLQAFHPLRYQRILRNSLTAMEEGYRKVLERQRAKFRCAVTVERLFVPLAVSHVLSSEELLEIQNEHPSQRVDRLLDLVQRKGYETFKKLCVVLETTYPYMLNCMFLGVEPPITAGSSLLRKNEQTQHSDNEENEAGRQIQCVGTRRGNVGRSISMSGHDLYKDKISILKNDLKATKQELEQTRNQLHKVEAEKDAYKKLSDFSNQKNGERISDENGLLNGVPRGREHQKDYDRLKNQYVDALKELELLKHKHSEMSDGYDSACLEADSQRKQHKTAKAKCDILLRDVHVLKRKLEEVNCDRDKVLLDYEEIVLLREREKIESCGLVGENAFKGISKPPSSDTKFPKYESLLKDYNDIQETHRQLRAEYNHNFNQLHNLEVDYSALKDQLDQLHKERDSLVMESTGLKQQSESVLMKYEKAKKALEMALKNSCEAQQEKDNAMRKYDHAMEHQRKTAKEMSRLSEDRNAIFNEYQLVMSERDIVHREIEKLQEELVQSQKENENLKAEDGRSKSRHSALQNELNMLYSEHKKTVKETFTLKDQLSKALSEKEFYMKDIEKTKDDNEMFKQERDAARKERSEAIIHRDKILRECFEVKQKHDLVVKGESKEIDALRRQFDVLSKELTEALNDVEISKKRRDWAFTERDKLVAERDDIRDMCDHLRQERDTAISDLAELLQDSDVTRRERVNYMTELLSLRSRVQALVNRDEFLTSQDSAIDTDSNEWEMESVILEKVNHKGGLGIAIAGGRNTPVTPNDSSIVITSVAKGSLAYGKLRVNDCVLKVNNVDLTNVEYHTAMQVISSSDILNMMVKRKRPLNKPYIQPVQLRVCEGKEMGIRLDQSKCISCIIPGSVAAQDDTLAVGDRILSINGLSVEDLSLLETEDMLCTSLLSLAVQKFGLPPSRTDTLQSLLDELNDKIERESDLSQRTQHARERFLTKLPSNEIPRGHQDSSSLFQPTPEDQISSTPESISDAGFHSSLTPLYEDNKETSHCTRTDSSDVSLGAGSDVHLISSGSPKVLSLKKSIQSIGSSTSSNASPRLGVIFDSAQKAKPPPPLRTCSYMSAVMSPLSESVVDARLSEQLGSHEQNPTSMESMHFPSSSLPDTTPLDEQGATSVPEKRGSSIVKNMRPQSAPAARQFQVSLGSSPGSSQYERYSSHVDPLALTPPKPHPSGPPASVAVLKSRNVPCYTATSHTMPSHDSTQHCVPVQCWETSQKWGKSRSQGNGLKQMSSEMLEGSNRHVRQGSSHSVDTQEFRKRSSSYHRYERTSGGSKRSHRVSLPTPRARLTSYPSDGSRSRCDSSSGSLNSYSSGQMTPIIPPSTPIVPGEPPLAFDFSGPLSLKELVAENRDYEPRRIQLEKEDTLGISIASASRGGIFVCSVSKGSVAYKAGLRYGDQLLEYNGVNLRCATYEQAAKILKISGNNVTILAQFNPQKFLDLCESTSSSSESSTTVTPNIRRKHKREGSTITPPLRRDEGVLPLTDSDAPGEMRYVFFKKSPSSLGLSLVGGNATGIFVSDIDPDGGIPTGPNGLNVGDHILEVNGEDLMSATAETATLEMCKPAEAVRILAQYNPSKFNAVRDQPGDSFYVRALYDHVTHSKDEMSFKKGDILYVTDTVYQGHVGCWKAWRISEEDAQKRESGKVPSRMKAEQEILLRRSVALGHGDEFKLSGRRSFFRRSKKSAHGMTVNHSRESSDSTTSLPSLPDPGLASYQTVEKLDSHITRAVVVFGPLVDVLYEKLCEEVPYKFVHCKPELVNLSEDKVEKGIADGTFVDCRWKGNQPCCTTLASIKQVSDKHCLLDVSLSAIERLHALQVYPIVLFVKFKSAKHIRDSKDARHPREKMTLREAKEVFQASLKLEREQKHVFNGVVHGSSLSNICSNLQLAVSEMQKKTVWVPLPGV